MHVLVTRPQPQADEWVARLTALGVTATALPLLGIHGPADEGAVRQAWATLPRHRAAMFVSPNAVDHFFAAAPQSPATWPSTVWAAGTGPGTAAALRHAGVPAGQVICPSADSERFDSEALWPLLQVRGPWLGASMLIVRGAGGRDWLADRLRAEGGVVEFVEAYRRSPPVLDPAGRACLAAALDRPAENVWLLSSSEAVRYLPGLAPDAPWRHALALATHPRIADAAREVGFGQVAMVAPGPEAVADWLTRSIQSSPS